MNSRKLPKPAKKDRVWQEKIEKRVGDEKVELTQPKGKERFEHVILNMIKKTKP